MATPVPRHSRLTQILSQSTSPSRIRAASVARRTKPAPPYPYGEAQWYKKSNRGLFGGQRIQFGNNVSEKSETKTRRTWHPNTQQKKLWSTGLNQFVRVLVTTRVLRTIDKVGGLDEYLLGNTTARLKEIGPIGWKLRWLVQNTVHWRTKNAFEYQKREAAKELDTIRRTASESVRKETSGSTRKAPVPRAKAKYKPRRVPDDVVSGPNHAVTNSVA